MTLAQILSQIDAAKVEIDGLRPINPDQEQRIMQKFRLDWTYHSNAIEGNSLSFGETKAFLLHGVTAQGKPFRDYLDIRGHHAALDYLLEIVRQKTPITEAAVRELHKIILVEPYDVDAVTQDGRLTKRRIIPGQYKTTPNHVHTSTGEIHYYASPEETPAKMADLMAWYRQTQEKGELHPLVLSATFHYQFVTIHPFDDGNGRMARLLMNLILMQAGFPPVIVPIDTKNEYLLALEQADADNDLDPFVTLIGQALLKSLDLFLRGAKGYIIEDIDDLDKKLTLLEKKVMAQDEIELRRDAAREENKSKLLYDILAPFLSQLHSQLVKFNRFFEEFKCVSSEGGRDIIFSFDEVDQLTNHLSSLLGRLSPLQIRYRWNRFHTDKKFDLWLVLDIRFGIDEFEISYRLSKSRTYDTIVQGSYDELYSDDEITKFALTTANALYQIIEQKVTGDLNKR
jgi:Fic family protein